MVWTAVHEPVGAVSAAVTAAFVDFVVAIGTLPLAVQPFRRSHCLTKLLKSEWLA
jgi:hypothetical protein